MLNALKIGFALYALYATAMSLQYALWIRVGDPISMMGREGMEWLRAWLWAGFAVCLLPIAWGLARQKKWAWNAAAGLLIFRTVWSVATIGGMFLSPVLNKAAFVPVFLRQFAFVAAQFLVLFTLLVLARRSYQTAFAPATGGGEAQPHRNSYVTPVMLGVLFLLIGLLVFAHPVAGEFSPTWLRVVSLVLVAFCWCGAVLCFFERRARIVRYHATFATVAVVAGLLGSLTFYAYFALMGLFVSGGQLLLSVPAIFAAAKARVSFVD